MLNALYCMLYFRDLGSEQRYARFCGRLVVLSVLVLLLYPFLWVWTVVGTLWFTSARSCVSSPSTVQLYHYNIRTYEHQLLISTPFLFLMVTAARRRPEMGFSHLAAFQLLWISLHSLYFCWKGLLCISMSVHNLIF